MTVDKSVPLSVLIPLVILQTVPELLADIYANGFECLFGMLRLHQQYWKRITWLNVVFKLAVTLGVLGFCLCATVVAEPL